MIKNHYEVLGAHPEMTDLEIRQLYRSLARQHHPDRHGDADKFADVTAAYAAVQTAKQRASLRAAFALVAPACGQCSTSGVTRKTKGFTTTETVPCDLCHGAGYMLGAGVAVKSYTRKKK